MTISTRFLENATTPVITFDKKLLYKKTVVTAAFDAKDIELEIINYPDQDDLGNLIEEIIIRFWDGINPIEKIDLPEPLLNDLIAGTKLTKEEVKYVLNARLSAVVTLLTKLAE